jgi:hypothetical protein
MKGSRHIWGYLKFTHRSLNKVENKNIRNKYNILILQQSLCHDIARNFLLRDAYENGSIQEQA